MLFIFTDTTSLWQRLRWKNT